jgi:ribosomal protein L14
MIQKLSICVPLDRCGVWAVKIFHIYSGFRHKIGKPGNFIKCSIKRTKPNNQICRGIKSNGILINSVFQLRKKDGVKYSFKNNTVVLLKKRLTPRGRELYGIIPFLIKRKKFCSSFPGII